MEHDADDVLADVVHVALHRREHDPAGRLPLREPKLLLLLLHEGHEIGDGLLHHSGGLHHLRQEHLACAEQIADHAHAGHQRAFDDMQRTLGFGARLLGVLLDEAADAMHQRVGQALPDRLVAPGKIDLAFLRAPAPITLGGFEQAVGRVGAAVEDDVLDELA